MHMRRILIMAARILGPMLITRLMRRRKKTNRNVSNQQNTNHQNHIQDQQTPEE